MEEKKMKGKQKKRKEKQRWEKKGIKERKRKVTRTVRPFHSVSFPKLSFVLERHSVLKVLCLQTILFY